MKKSTILIIAVIAVAALAYFYFEGGLPNPGGDSALLESSEAVGVGSDVLSLLNQVQSLKIDTSLFSEPAYQTLKDYSVAIPAEPVGRVNPFAPLPGVPTVAPTAGQ